MPFVSKSILSQFLPNELSYFICLFFGPKVVELLACQSLAIKQRSQMLSWCSIMMSSWYHVDDALFTSYFIFLRFDCFIKNEFNSIHVSVCSSFLDLTECKRRSGATNRNLWHEIHLELTEAQAYIRCQRHISNYWQAVIVIEQPAQQKYYARRNSKKPNIIRMYQNEECTDVYLWEK